MTYENHDVVDEVRDCLSLIMKHYNTHKCHDAVDEAHASSIITDKFQDYLYVSSIASWSYENDDVVDEVRDCLSLMMKQTDITVWLHRSTLNSNRR